MLSVFAVSACTSSFSAPSREAPERKAIIPDPVRCDPKVAGRDLALIGGEWRYCALENEQRLDVAACNYLDYVASLKAGKPARTEAPECKGKRQ